MSAESSPEGTGPKLKLRPPGSRPNAPSDKPPPDKPATESAAKDASAESPEKPRGKPRLSLNPTGSDPSAPAAPDTPPAGTSADAGATPPVKIKLRARLPTPAESPAAPTSEPAETPPTAGSSDAERPPSVTHEKPRMSVTPVETGESVSPFPDEPPQEQMTPVESTKLSVDDAARVGLSKLTMKPFEVTARSASQPALTAAQRAAPFSAKKRPRSSRSVMRMAIAAGGLLVLVLAGILAYVKFVLAPLPPLPSFPKPGVVRQPTSAPEPAARPQSPSAAPAGSASSTAGPPKAAATGSSAPASAGVPAPKAAMPAPPPPPPKASPEFRAFVDQLRISGFHVGSPSRAIINGVTYQDGEVVNHDLGVVFVGIDPKTQMLVFKDDTGAVLRRAF